jgi:ketosteroid isomerase-like protein
MSQENVEIVRRTIDAWNRCDVDAWMRGYHPQIEYMSAVLWRVEGPQTFRGHTEMRRFWDEWHSLWNLTNDISDLRDLGDTVVAIGVYRTRGNASGVGLEGPIAYVCEFDAGLARRVTAYLDPSQAREAVGLSE